MAETELERPVPGARWFRSWGERSVAVELRVARALVRGPIGLAAMADRAARLRGLVLANTVIGPPRPGFRPTAFHRLARLPVIAPALFRGLGFPLPVLHLAQGDGSYLKEMTKLEKQQLLILDDWGMTPLDQAARHDLLEVIDDRATSKSTIITSQLPIDHWHAWLNDPTVADAILDRLVHNAYKLSLQGDSMRKRNQITPARPRSRAAER